MPNGPNPSPAWSEDEAREYASLLDLANDAVIVMTLDGDVRFWNEGAVRLYGWTKAEALGKRTHDLLKTSFPLPLDQIKLITRREGEWRGDLVHTTRDGRRILVASRWTPRYARDGQLIGTFEINRDVTQEREAQEALIRAENVDRLATLGRLAASVAHEINNPLDSLRGILHLLASSKDGENADLIEAGINEVQRAMDIVKGTLGFARDHRSIVDARLPEIVDGVLAMYAGRMRSHAITVEKRYTTAGQIICRPGELRQVFANLIGNAVDAMRNGEGGRLRVHIHHASLLHSPAYRVTVSDEGVGIPETFLPRIFEPFFSTKGEMGTGLGLWISRSIVGKQGGSIRFRSRCGMPKRGTLFSVVLRAVQPVTAPGEFQQKLGT